MIYQTGSANIRVGSSSVVGNSTSWLANISAGDLFKLSNDSAFYTVSSVSTATKLSLSTRYRNSSHETSRSQHIATTNSTDLTYTGTLSTVPCLLESVVVLGSDERFTDDGDGTLTGDDGGSGSYDPDTGAISITYNASPTVGYGISASHLSGDSLNAVSYQIVKDFTTNYSFPEMGLNAINFPTIYTHAVRMIDSAMYTASISQATVAGDVYVSATPYGFVTKSSDGTKWRITVSNEGTVLTATIG
jgi:hypothetical protein